MCHFSLYGFTLIGDTEGGTEGVLKYLHQMI